MSHNELLRSLFKNNENPIEAKITGELPCWLAGTLFRNGPGRYEYGDKEYQHLFDGQSCVHKFKIEGGKVFYSSRFLESNSYLKSCKNERLYQVFGTVDICSSFFGRVKTLFFPPDTFDNVNINIVPFSNQTLYALTETNFLMRIDPKDLTILNRINLTAHIPTATTTNSHPHIDSEGSWIIAGLNVSNRLKRPRYEFIKYLSTTDDSESLDNICKSGQILCSIRSSHRFGAAYFHSFAITDNYIIFIEQSLKISFYELIKTALFNKPFSKCMITLKDWPAKIHVIRKDTGEPIKQKYITEPLIAFHHINAFETMDSENNIDLVVDICAYNPSKFDINRFTRNDMYTERMEESDLLLSTAKRLTIPLNTSKIANGSPIVCGLRCINPGVIFELPCINYARFNGKPYKFIYGTNYYKKPFSIIKLNVEDPEEIFEKKYEEPGRSFLPSEPVFVEKPNPVSEDDGVILVMVLSNKNDYLSVLNAKDLKEIAKAEVAEDVKMAFTFHGTFASAYLSCKKIYEMS